MGEVVRLTELRNARKTAKPSRSKPQVSYSYFCTRCDTDLFRLHPDGEVHCAGCDTLIDNLKIADSARDKQTG